MVEVVMIKAVGAQVGRGTSRSRRRTIILWTYPLVMKGVDGE